MSRILIIDDEAPFARALSIGLRARGYEVDWSDRGKEGLAQAAAVHPDLVVLDLGLPDLDGSQVLGALRAWTSAPVIVLSARHQEQAKVEALDAGADDYVTKPFGMGELLARMRAALRRIEPSEGQATIATPDFTIDLTARRATAPAGTVKLTPTEWHMVEVLVRNRGKLVPQSYLLREVWGNQYEHEFEYLRVYIGRIRRKLEPNPSKPRYFLTDPGMGYRFEYEELPPQLPS